MKRFAAIKHSFGPWLRSPNTGYTYYVYYVQASGASNNNNANNANGFSLDCIIDPQGSGESKFHRETETPQSCKEPQTLPRVNHAANQNRRRRPLFKKAVPATGADPFSFANLVIAAKSCCAGVLWKDSVMRWRLDYLHLCRKLERELATGKYHLSKYVVFHIVSPKPRIIRSLHFRDRVVQRAMCQNGLYADLTRGNIYDNGACQSNKGTAFALDRMKVLLLRYYRRHGADGYVLRLDIRKFFDSIPHDRLCAMVRRKVRNPQFADMVCDIIRSFGGDRGIGLGSQISQLLAVSYLSDLDHEIKEKMKIQCYCRYSDDIVLVHPDKAYLQECRRRITARLAEMGLTLNPKSTMHSLRQGITFLKFHYVITRTGKVVYYVVRSSITRARRRTFRLIRKYRAGKTTIAEIRTSFNAWASFALQGAKKIKIMRLQQQIERMLQNENLYA